jgi:N-formylmaleamate deformylase
MPSTFCYGAHVRANGIRQHYLRYGGHGPAVVIVPGITSPAVTWGFVAERFGRTFDTYVLDVRGRGLSEASAALDYGLDACAADVIAFTRAAGLEEYAIVGHSMGARIAVRAASRHADASASSGLTRVVMVDPPVSGPGRRRYPTPLSWYLDSIRLMREGAGVDALRPYAPTWTIEHLRLRAEWLPTCDERAVVDAYTGFHEDDIHADVSRVRVPALLIAAGKADVLQPDDIDEIRRLAPAIRVAVVEGAGHMIPWDDYDGFFDAFSDFLGHRV